MRFSNIALGLGIALLIGIAFLFRENQIFERQKLLVNPFLSQTVLDDKQVTAVDNFSDYFLTSGGFVRLYRGAEVDFSDPKKEFITGDMLIAGGIEDRIVIKNLKLNVAEKLVYVSLDTRQQKLEIFSLRGSVDIFSDKGALIVSLPHRNRAEFKLSEDSVLLPTIPTENTYYTLKKALGIAPWSQKSDTIMKGRLAFSSYYRSWTKPFDVFAKKFLQHYSAGTPQNIFTTLADRYSRFQSLYSLWFPAKKRAERQFARTLNPLQDAYHLVDEKKYPAAKAQVSAFRDTIHSTAWQSFLNKNPDLKKQWDFFLWAHKIWFSAMVPDEAKSVFAPLWNISSGKMHETTKALLAKVDIATHYETDQASEVFQTFVDIGKLFTTKTVDSASGKKTQTNETAHFAVAEDRFFVTRARRSLTNLLLINEVFQKQKIYKMYQAVVLGELQMYQPYQTEKVKLRIELAHEILSLIDHFIKSPSESEISDILLSLWKVINIDEIEADQRKSFFSKVERDLIQFVNISASTTLTEEDIKDIQATEALAETLQAEIEKLQPDGNDEENVPAVPQSQPIENPKDLIDLLTTQGITVDLFHFKTDREQGVTDFSRGTFLTKKIDGQFDYGSQRFLDLTIDGTDKHARVHISFLPGILGSIKTNHERQIQALAREESGETQAEEDLFAVVETTVLQNTERSILARRLVNNLLKNYGFIVKRQNVFVLDEALENFAVVSAEILDTHELRFDYNKPNNWFSNIKGKYVLEARAADEELGVTAREESEATFVLTESYPWNKFIPALQKKIQALEDL